MEYRTIPHSGEKVSIIGLGMGSMHEASVDETERTVLEAIDAGINIMDFIPSKANAFEGYARALKTRREKCCSRFTWVQTTHRVNTDGLQT